MRFAAVRKVDKIRDFCYYMLEQYHTESFDVPKRFCDVSFNDTAAQGFVFSHLKREKFLHSF